MVEMKDINVIMHIKVKISLWDAIKLRISGKEAKDLINIHVKEEQDGKNCKKN